MTYDISIAICTMDRPDLLERCLSSIAGGISLPEEVLVSDDSSNPEATRRVCAAYSFVTYLIGPRRGLCANRNRIVHAVRTSHACLLDDDSTVAPDFIQKVRAVLPTLDQKTVLTGDVLEYGGRTRPKNPTFWGHFKADPAGDYRTINLNCNVFPIASFRHAGFDESVMYGYEDMDLCASLLSKGFRIRYEPSLVNRHLPPKKQEAEIRRRYRLVQQARFQVTMKRYVVLEDNIAKSVAFCFFAPLHRSAHAIKTQQWEDIPRALTDISMAIRGALKTRAANKSTRNQAGFSADPHAWIPRVYSKS